MTDMGGLTFSGLKTDTPEYFCAGEFRLPLFHKAYVMGILNITPDSFSDGGRYLSVDDAVRRAGQMVSEGAHIIDVGGESTRPGHTPVDAAEEISRILPVIRALKTELKVPISVDTWKADVAKAAVSAGASIINDIWGLKREPGIAKIAAETGTGLIMMFNAFDPSLFERTGDITADALRYLGDSIRIARNAGVRDEQMMIDPGIGFGVDAEESLTLIRSIPAFCGLGVPVLIGPSRKRFIGAVLDKPVDERMIGTVSACMTGVNLGASAVRVHDVFEVSEALRMRDAILYNEWRPKEVL